MTREDIVREILLKLFETMPIEREVGYTIYRIAGDDIKKMCSEVKQEASREA